MKNIYPNILKSNLRNLYRAKRNIENNNIIGLPTETVYGLAGNAYSNKSVKKIFYIKKRPSYNPLIIHFKNLKNAKKDVVVNNNFLKLYSALCPGPITFILKKKHTSKISKIASAKKKTIAIRFPKHNVARKLLSLLKVPLAAPSANISSKLSPTSPNDVVEEFKDKIKIILDGGKSKIGLESTIVDLTDKPKILRPGSITSKKISKILNKRVTVCKKINEIKSPGQLKIHYSPGIPVKMNKIINSNKNEALIVFGKIYKKSNKYFNLSKKGDLHEAANNLYKILREIKNKGFKSIAVNKIPNVGIGIAINDRLRKASNK